MREFIFILSFVLGYCATAFAQDTEENASVQVLSYVSRDTIYLRWAINQAAAWKRTNENGYIIERYTVAKKGKTLSVPIKKILNNIPLKPEPLEKWEEMVTNNDYAAILAQALYGENFKVEGSDPGSLMQIVNRSKEIEQRFSFALLAADMNFDAAIKAGLGFVDTDIVSDEKYLYRVRAIVPEKFPGIRHGSVVADLTTPTKLPKPNGFTAVPGDKTVLLSWNYKIFAGIFTSYFLERSSDGSKFKRLGDTPILNLNSKEGSEQRNIAYVDTIPRNDTQYFYRVKGISPFGKVSPASEIVKAIGKAPLEAVPILGSSEIDATGTVKLQWEFPKEEENKVQSFELNRSSKSTGPYQVVSYNIPVSNRNIDYLVTEPSNYFTITALGLRNEKKTSLSVFVQTIDSIPPAIPLGVNGVIDTTGVVQLNWEKNLEKDLLGYRVFRGNRDGEELTQLTTDPIPLSTFKDSVNLATFSNDVYYSVVAVDRRYNMSDYSEVIEVKKPDVIPPTSPIFHKYEITEKGIDLSWRNSSSVDATKHTLFRKDITEGDEDWSTIFTTDTISSYIDTKVTDGHRYRYAVFAEDRNGLISAPSTPLTLTRVQGKASTVLKNVRAFANNDEGRIELSWKVITPNVKEIAIYKSKKGETPKLFRQIPGTIDSIKDSSVFPSTTYIYHFKPILENGLPEFETITVNY